MERGSMQDIGVVRCDQAWIYELILRLSRMQWDERNNSSSSSAICDGLVYEIGISHGTRVSEGVDGLSRNDCKCQFKNI